jgi:hypothetical protein
MKNLFTTAVLFIATAIFSNQLSANNHPRLKYDSTSCLQIEGRILNAEENDGECTVELIDNENQICDSVLLKEGKTRFAFVLQKNKYYAIRITKKGFINKLITVNTEMLVESDGIHKFNFETKLMHKAALKRINADVVDFPVAIIHFDYENDCFGYNKEYTDSIKKELFASTANQNTRSKN